MWNEIHDAVVPMLRQQLQEMINDGDDEIESLLVATLLLDDQAFINAPWWQKDWPREAQDRDNVHLLCNDVFAWGFADAETPAHGDWEEIADFYLKDRVWGIAVWCCKKRGMMPQPPVEDAMRKAGWDLDVFRLKTNPAKKN